MILTTLLRQNSEAIRRVGTDARDEARRAGVPAYYMDPALGDGIVRDMPDGTCERVERRDGRRTVVETYDPRT
ncbi:hypothetical protein MKK63_12590 [Methylobacterium sp. J-088]|uniref:hypothetical protein n=1 Tax=Methylobacterium sp. J-088 TaxID=2836664 RepID=UPI001FB99559|nr:hypothetical protein [Methylobacterium sp. J-088]MCJ2063544.1 hypothetical protein [Methylobacterium sp. J-088]